VVRPTSTHGGPPSPPELHQAKEIRDVTARLREYLEELDHYLQGATKIQVALDGSPVASRRRIDFLQGDNVTITVADDAENESVTVEIESTAVGGAGGGMAVLAKTADYAVDAGDTDTLFTNEGAGATVTFTLPAAAAELHFAFHVAAAETVIVEAGAGDTIRIAGLVSAAAGSATTEAQGSTLELIAINATEWVAVAHVGPWEVA
jgi:hypothetical protein